MADGHGNRDDPEGVWRNRQGAHAAQVAAQDRVLLEKGQVRPVQVSLQREAGGVQKGGRGARGPEARGRYDRLCRGRGRGPKVPEPRLRVEADRGGGEQVRTSFSRESVRIFGAMSQDELRIKIVESTNSEAFREFLEEIRRDRPRLFMVLDNASYHKSKAVREYVESAGGDVELEFLPPYTPQLNPVETVWRDLKKRLAGRFFRSLDELKAAITAILEREMGNRLKGYLVA